jgi:hypothetical protein
MGILRSGARRNKQVNGSNSGLPAQETSEFKADHRPHAVAEKRKGDIQVRLKSLGRLVNRVGHSSE